MIKNLLEQIRHMKNDVPEAFGRPVSEEEIIEAVGTKILTNRIGKK